MSFVDTLRNARGTRVAVLHEFWTQYNPHQRRVHAFYEGHDDRIFFSSFLMQFAPPGTRFYSYRCEGKGRVFEAFTQITQRAPDIKLVLFFVDKDLDDILGIPWATDPRIFVTDVYSIENYVVTPAVLKRLYCDCVRLTRVTFDDEAVFVQFEQQLKRFHRKMLSIMAWVLVTRRAGGRPNLNNVSMRDLCTISDACEVRRAPGPRLVSLERTTQAAISGSTFKRIFYVTKELARMPPKRIMRGKFEAWFFVEFWKKLVMQLQTLARESGGNVQVKVTLEHRTFLSTLIGYVEIPRSLELFLRAHLSELAGVASSDVPRRRRRDFGFVQKWWRKTVDALLK